MEVTKKPLYVKAQVYLGLYDEDGNLTGVQPVPEVRDLYYPMTSQLSQYLDEIGRECREETRDDAPRR